jgi:GT2 family glycosyltransferase
VLVTAPTRDVVGNDWMTLVPPPDATWTPRATVSICVPTRNPGRGLARTLRCLAEQTYPSHLFEVVVGDDGSDAPIDLPGGLPYETRVVRQDRTLDFGAGRARNLAGRSASGDILFFLDADVIPERQVVESYARWFAQSDLAVPMGLCRFVDVDDLDDDVLVDLVANDGMGGYFANTEVDDQTWRETHFLRTNDLRSEAIDAFRVVIGATLAVSASGFAAVGGFPELGVRGVEDTAFGYRIHNDGGVLILDRDAQHWHQGRRNLSDPLVRQRINEVRAPYVESVMPVKGFRRGEPPTDPPVDVAPVARVRVHGDPAAADQTRRSVTAIRSANVAFAEDLVGAVSDPAFLQVDLPAGVTWSSATVSRLVDTMSQHPVGVIKALVEGSAGEFVTVSRTRALRRALRTRPDADPISTAGELFGTWWVDAASLSLRSPHTAADMDHATDRDADKGPTLAARALDRLIDLLTRAAK